MDFLKNYWPAIAILAFFSLKWWNGFMVKKSLPELKSKGAQLLDVRSKAEYQSAHAPGSINIPLNELAQRLNEVSKLKPIVVCCASGTRSGMAKVLLKKNGYIDVHNIGSWTNLMN